MKKQFLILIFLLSIQNSLQIVKLSDKGVEIFKCIFDDREKIDSYLNMIYTLYTSDQTLSLLIPLLSSATSIGNCFGLTNEDIMKIIMEYIPIPGELSQIFMLKNIREANAPLLLRKYLYDTVIKNGASKAKIECYQMTKMTPYDNYKSLCNLFNIK